MRSLTNLPQFDSSRNNVTDAPVNGFRASTNAIASQVNYALCNVSVVTSALLNVISDTTNLTPSTSTNPWSNMLNDLQPQLQGELNNYLSKVLTNYLSGTGEVLLNTISTGRSGVGYSYLQGAYVGVQKGLSSNYLAITSLGSLNTSSLSLQPSSNYYAEFDVVDKSGFNITVKNGNVETSYSLKPSTLKNDYIATGSTLNSVSRYANSRIKTTRFSYGSTAEENWDRFKNLILNTTTFGNHYEKILSIVLHSNYVLGQSGDYYYNAQLQVDKKTSIVKLYFANMRDTAGSITTLDSTNDYIEVTYWDNSVWSN